MNVVFPLSPNNEKPPFQVVDYRAVDLVEYLSANYSSSSSPEKQQFDIIYDCTGLTPALYSSSPAYLRPTGTYVDICTMAAPKETGGHIRSFVRLLERTWRPSWLGGTPRRYKSALLLAHNSVRRPWGFSGPPVLFSVWSWPISISIDPPVSFFGFFP
jgi:threonine dehydrogenase-like Zn-dependent dehydrogenase